MVTALQQLTRSKPLPQLPNADQWVPSPHPPVSIPSPRRLLGWIVPLTLDVRYASGEHTIKYILRSRYALYKNFLLPAALLLFLLASSLIVPGVFSLGPLLKWLWWMGSGVLALSLLSGMALVNRKHQSTVVVLSSRRLIDIAQKQEVEYKDIHTVKVVVPSLLQRLLDVGNIVIETASHAPSVILRAVDHPLLLRQELLRLKEYKKGEEAAKKKQEEKANLHQWFAAVLSRLEATRQSIEVPDVRGQDVLTAKTSAQKIGLDVVVWGEMEAGEALLSRSIVHQNPLPGTMREKGSRIEVVLRKW